MRCRRRVIPAVTAGANPGTARGLATFMGSHPHAVVAWKRYTAMYQPTLEIRSQLVVGMLQWCVVLMISSIRHP